MSRTLSLMVLLFPALAHAAPPTVSAVAYHPKGEVLAAGTHGEVKLFDPMGTGIGGFAVPGRVSAIAFDPTGKWLAVASGETGKNGDVRVFAVNREGRVEPKAKHTFSVHKDAVYAVAFSPDGGRLATAGYDRVINIFKLDGVVATPELTLKDHSDAIYSLSWNRDGTLLASGAADRSVKVWDTATGKRLYTLSDPTDWVYCVAWSPDGKHLAAGGVDKSVRVWETNREGGKLVRSAFAHEKAVWRLVYSADGGQMYTVGEDRAMKAWDTAKLTETKVYATQPDTVLDLALQPSGKQLAVARFDGVLVLLDAATGKQLAQPLPAKPAPAPPETPKVAPANPQKLTPVGVPRGKTTSVAVSGKNLDQVKAVTSSRPDVEVRIGKERAADSLTLEVTVQPNIHAGMATLTFEDAAGKATLALALDRVTAIPEVGATDSATTGMAITFPASVAGTLDRAGDIDYFRFSAKAGQQIGVHLVATELGSKVDPVLILTSRDGTILAEGATFLGVVVPKAGDYAIGVRDKEYRGGSDFTYRLHVGDTPVVTGVFPLAVQRGRTTEIHVEGVNLGSQSGVQVKVTVPADAMPGSKVNVPVSSSHEIPLGSPTVVVSEFTSVVVGGPEATDLRVPGSADGILTTPGQAQLLRFTAKKGQRLMVEALARRAGSPVDPIIEILDGDGKPVPRAVLRCTAKTFSTFRDHDSANPGIRLEIWNELGIDDYLFANGDLLRILAMPKGPDDDCQFYQVAGQRVGFLGTTPQHHAQNSPMYKVEFHPPIAVFPPNGLPVFTLHYRNDDGGPGYGKDSALLFEAPADGTYAVRLTDARGASGPTHAYRVTVRPPKPDFTLAFNPTAPSISAGGGISVNVTLTRADGFDGPVRVKLEGLPPGFTAPETFVEAGQTTTAFTLSATTDAKVPVGFKLKITGRATIDGKEVEREALGGVPAVVAIGDLVTTTHVSKISIQPGKESRFTVDIARQGKFAGRVPIEVKGLPHGVRVMNIGLNGILITERDTSREVVLYAEPWVKPTDRPIVVLARREGTNAESAMSVQLKVEK